MRYPVNLERDGDGFCVSFPDIPRGVDFRCVEEEALEMAKDALETALEYYSKDGRPAPLSSEIKPGQRYVELRCKPREG